MKKYLKYLVCTAITLVLITLLALAYGSASKSRYLVDVPDNGIEVSFRDDYRFVSSDDIKGYINKYYGSVYGYRTDSLNLAGMERMLDLHPGSVSVLGLMHDREHRVRLLIDEDVLKEELFGCHPCENTSSIRFATRDLTEKILPALGAEPTLVHLAGT